MTPDEFNRKVLRCRNYLENDLPRKVGVEGQRHFKRSFHDEGFTDERLEKWPDVKRRTHPPKSQVGKASSRRKILTGETGDLGNSLEWDAMPEGVKFSSDLPYAQVNNEGGQAGRGRKARIPKRQFVGPSKVLMGKLEGIVDADMAKIFNS